jgi:hypothetical protein
MYKSSLRHIHDPVLSSLVVMCIGYIFLTYDMYKFSLRHIHDPVLSSLKMKGIRLLFSLTQSFRPHNSPGVDSASNRNEYQEYFLGVKAAGA